MVILTAFLSMLDKDSGPGLLRRVVLASFPPSGDHSFVTWINDNAVDCGSIKPVPDVQIVGKEVQDSKRKKRRCCP